MIGGVVVDLDGRTSIDGLWAAGEGHQLRPARSQPACLQQFARRLVFGARVGQLASSAAASMPDDFRVPKLSHAPTQTDGVSLDIFDIRNALQSLMWRLVGVQRRDDRLQEALSAIESYSRYVLTYNFNSEAGWELQNMITVAHLMAQAALARTESRGTHFRLDYPKLDEANWHRHLKFSRPPHSRTGS